MASDSKYDTVHENDKLIRSSSDSLSERTIPFSFLSLPHPLSFYLHNNIVYKCNSLTNIW